MSAQQDERAVEQRVKREHKRREREAEAYVGDRKAEADELEMDIALLEAERLGEEALAATEGKPATTAAHELQVRFQEQGRAFLERSPIDSRARAVWALKRFAEAKHRLKEVKAAMRGEVRRATNALKRRAEWLLDAAVDWVDKNVQRTAAKSTRVPEAGVRVEFREVKEGWRVTDGEKAKETVLRLVGIMRATELGVVETKIRLKESKARALVAQLADEHARKNGEVLDLPGFDYYFPEEGSYAVRVVPISSRDGEEDDDDGEED